MRQPARNASADWYRELNERTNSFQLDSGTTGRGRPKGKSSPIAPPDWAWRNALREAIAASRPGLPPGNSDAGQVCVIRNRPPLIRPVEIQIRLPASSAPLKSTPWTTDSSATPLRLTTSDSLAREDRALMPGLRCESPVAPLSGQVQCSLHPVVDSALEMECAWLGGAFHRRQRPGLSRRADAVSGSSEHTRIDDE